VFPVLFHFGALLIPSYGVVTALGLLLALFLTQRTAHICALNPNHLWNLSILSLVAALIGSRLLLALWNFSTLIHHPLWILGLAMIHHPLLATAGTLTGALAAFAYARAVKIPLAPLADALAAPLALGFAFEQIAAFLAGSGYGLSTASEWAVTYTDPRAELWSGTPLDIPLYPVQLYASVAAFAIAAVSYFLLRHRRQSGDAAGVALIIGGAALFLTEFLRSREGRGAFFGRVIDGPQLISLWLVLIGGWLLMKRNSCQLSITGDSTQQHHTEETGNPTHE
jgi:phosphatidylglycerol---prolipoprotein diacylglyceryl transferase